jgi:hypothetical protein
MVVLHARELKYGMSASSVAQHPDTDRMRRVAVGGIITGVASTIAGSWISSKIHV